MVSFGGNWGVNTRQSGGLKMGNDKSGCKGVFLILLILISIFIIVLLS